MRHIAKTVQYLRLQLCKYPLVFTRKKHFFPKRSIFLFILSSY